MKKQLSVLLAALFCGQFWSAVPYADEVQSSVPGDICPDGRLDWYDVSALMQWLRSDFVDAVYAGDWRVADLNADGLLNSVDLTLMKQAILNAEVPAPDLIAPPVLALSPTMPSVGTVQIPVIAVSFPDCAFSGDVTAALQGSCFSAPDPGHADYPLESISAYFQRASYGRFSLGGDVYSVTAKHSLDWYAEDSAWELTEEVLAALTEVTDLAQYDADGDAVLDAAVFVLPEAALETDRDENGQPDWWPYSVNHRSDTPFGGIRTGTCCIMHFDPANPSVFVNQTAHELCHAMGLPDYYKYIQDGISEKDAMLGEAGNELLDEGYGDLSACSKLLLGWLAEDELQVYHGGQEMFRLTSMQYAPSCILIPRDPDAGLLSEYFLIEYNTHEANNAQHGGTGIRILHVQAECTEGAHGKVLKYSNYSPAYDAGNEKQRVLRLVNEDGFFYGLFYGQQPDRKLTDGNTAGFHWYSEDGELTVDTGLQIRVFSASPGPFYDPQLLSPMSSLPVTSNPSYDPGSTYAIRIEETE